MIARWFSPCLVIGRYLLQGSDELYLPKEWLANKGRMRNYVGYTKRQLQQGSIVRDVAAMRRAAFWASRAAKPESIPENVTKFQKRAHR